MTLQNNHRNSKDNKVDTNRQDFQRIKSKVASLDNPAPPQPRKVQIQPHNQLYWQLWLALTIIASLAVIFSGNIGGGIGLGLLMAAYTSYLYNGGRFIILPVGLMVALLIIAPIGLIAEGVNFITGQTLNEHSSCSRFEKASPSQQQTVIQKMQTAHNDTGDSFANISVGAFCNLYPSQPVDGVYNGSL